MKARILFILALALTTVIPLAPPALAHHSFAAEYDADKPVTLTGSVTKMAWINPHSWIYIDVKKADGTVDGDQGERLPRERRRAASQRARHHAARWAIALRRRLQSRSTERFSGEEQVRTADEEGTHG